MYPALSKWVKQWSWKSIPNAPPRIDVRLFQIHISTPPHKIKQIRPILQHVLTHVQDQNRQLQIYYCWLSPRKKRLSCLAELKMVVSWNHNFLHAVVYMFCWRCPDVGVNFCRHLGELQEYVVSAPRGRQELSRVAQPSSNLCDYIISLSVDSRTSPQKHLLRTRSVRFICRLANISSGWQTPGLSCLYHGNIER